MRTRASSFLALVLGLAACGGGEPSSMVDGGTPDSGASEIDAPPGPTTPDPQFLPAVTGQCPTLAEGMATFSPDGNARDVLLWISDAAAELDGPIVFFWHGAGGSPSEAPLALGQDAIAAITAQGGIVAAPVHDPAAGLLPWFLALGTSQREDDLRVMDEVIACAIEQVGIDVRRIHSTGFSAGAMNTAHIAARRSGYIASVVTYSGARLGTPPVQDETNKYAAMIVHGGPTDVVIVINFETEAQRLDEALTGAGHFTVLCNHGGGHTVPGDARPSALRFLMDHPFGVRPRPYAAGLPEEFPDYCMP